jgi:hypothetical protein
LLTTHHSLDDDAALQQKVNEALSVYDDYVKSKDGVPEGTEAPAANGAGAAQEETASA